MIKMKYAVLALAGVMSLTSFGKITPGAPFANGMVLQRGVKLPVWGTAAAGSEVSVEFAGQRQVATADAAGAWKVSLEPLVASCENRSLVLSEKKGAEALDKVEIRDVLVGEVWIASGQSNMDCPIWGGNPRYRDGNGALVCAMANQPLVRLVKTPRRWSVKKEPIRAKWFKMTAADLKANNYSFSGVGYYFARELHLALGVPVGVIDSSWGGTNIDAWTPESAYANCDPSISCVASLPLFAKTEELVASLKDGAYAKYPGAKIYGTPENPGIVHQRCVIWNASVADYVPFAIKGFIWYQGCHNGGEPQFYRAKLHALYDGWSKEFANPALKMYLVELAPYSHNWMGICEAQNKFVAEEKNAAITVIADHGNFYDIHPNEKEIVGMRLAAHALKRDYGFAGIEEDDSPVFRSVVFNEDAALVSFDHVKNWYIYSPRRSLEVPFQLAGADGKWVNAEIVNLERRDNPVAKKNPEAPKKLQVEFIKGDTLALRAKGVDKPVKVRYMGENKTEGRLYNEASLPLGPFETK